MEAVDRRDAREPQPGAIASPFDTELKQKLPATDVPFRQLALCAARLCCRVRRGHNEGKQ